MHLKVLSLSLFIFMISCGNNSNREDRPADPDKSDNPDTNEDLPDAVQGTCDAKFLAPFCKDDRILGFDEGQWKRETPPSLAEIRQYSLRAVNHIRARTCLPPLKPDDRLHAIAEQALQANSGHGYFIKNCMNRERNYGKNCEAGWTQENIGSASGTGWTWKHGIHVPLCEMMKEGKGVGHRANIESAEWKRLGVGIKADANGASWFHEFGD
ncbi:MAG: CAP domain-containing protein [Pseudobdellovibrionaceae bacterium]|nr:CAP domain-containing protein [Pseudobdellovibrionaceae bacterium]